MATLCVVVVLPVLRNIHIHLELDFETIEDWSRSEWVWKGIKAIHAAYITCGACLMVRQGGPLCMDY